MEEVKVEKGNTEFERTGAVNIRCPNCDDFVTANLLVRSDMCPYCESKLSLTVKYHK